MNPTRIPVLVIAALFGLTLMLNLATQTAAQSTRPATPPTPASPPTYTLSAYWVFNSNPPDYVFVLNNIAYLDMPSLQTGMSDLPANTTIHWTAISTVIGKEPFTDPDDLKAFQKFCTDHKFKLVITPAG